MLNSPLGLYPSCYTYAFGLDVDHEYGRFYGYDFESPSNWEMLSYYSYAVMFTAEADGAIGAIGVMSLADFWESSFKVSAFVGCSEGNPVSGAQVMNRERYNVYVPGYRTVKLDNPFAVKKGQRFSIIIDRLAGHAVMNTANPVPGRCFRGTIKYNSDPVTKYEWTDMAGGVEIDTADKANTEGVVRSGNLVFACDGETRTFMIVQDVMPKVLDWNLCGKDTEKEQDRVTGDPVGDQCLVADGRFVIKLQFSHFNYERYPINLIDLKGEAKRDTSARRTSSRW